MQLHASAAQTIVGLERGGRRHFGTYGEVRVDLTLRGPQRYGDVTIPV